jgi:DNA (cytosine-5)-methyltransferase 1
MTTNENIRLIYVDLFCGAGGTSTGVENAKGYNRTIAKVIACVNHDENAIASHNANHPDALHFTEDIRTLDLTKLIAHVQFMRLMYPNAKLVLWASLECTNFSKAKGGQSRDADSRTLAEHLFRYVAALNPDYIHIENVEEFMSWGELDENGKPVSKNNGKDYLRWIKEICSHGYHSDFRILNSADFGAYTSRKRLFLQFAKYDLPIAWPEPTHCKGGSTGMFSFKKWKPVKDVLDFTDEGVSIFIRKKDLSEKTLERIYAGLIKFVAGGKDKWILKYNSTNGKTGKHNPPSIDEPCPVVSCQNRLGLVTANFISKYYSGHPDSFISAYYGNGDNVSSVDNPSPTVTTKDRLALVSPRFIDQQFGNGKAATVNNPLGTITTVPKYNLVTIKPWIMNTNFNNVGSSIDEPSQVVTANRKWHYLMNPQFASSGGSVDNPCFTLIARMDKMPPYLIIAENGQMSIRIEKDDSEFTVKIKEFMSIYGIIDIKMRMLKIPELKMIMGFPKDYKLIGTQAEQKKYIGNAVEVTMARVLCEAVAMKLNEQTKIAV